MPHLRLRKRWSDPKLSQALNKIPSCKGNLQMIIVVMTSPSKLINVMLILMLLGKIPHDVVGENPNIGEMSYCYVDLCWLKKKHLEWCSSIFLNLDRFQLPMIH
jgi:hypothetical protein